MAIKIPKASDLGIGRETPGAIPEGLARPVPLIRTGIGLELAQAAVDIAGTVVSAQAQAKEKAAKQAEQDRLKLQKAEGIVQKNKDNTAYANSVSSFTLAVDDIKNSDNSPQDKQTMFKKVQDTFGSDLKNTISPEAQDGFQAKAINATTKIRSNFSDHISKQAKDAEVANTTLTVENIVRTKTDSVDSRQLNKSLIVDAVKNVPGLTEVQKTNMILDAKTRIDKAAVSSLLNEVNDNGFHTQLDTVIKDLKAVDKDGNFTFYGDLTPAQRNGFIKSAQNTQETEADQRIASDLRAVKDATGRLRTLVDRGIPIRPDDVTELISRSKGTIYEETVNALVKEGSDPTALRAKLTKDPITVAAARLGIPLEPLALSDPEKLKIQLQLRKTIGQRVMDITGSSIMAILTDQEVQNLSSIMNSDPNRSVKGIASVMSDLGQDGAKGVAAQMSIVDPNNGTVLSALSDGDVFLANNFIEGQNLIKAKFPMPKAAEIDTWWNSRVGQSLFGLRNNGKQAKDAFLSIYAVEAQNKGVLDGNFDSDVARLALSRAVGEIQSINGHQTTIAPGLEETDLLDGIASVDDALVASLGGVEGISTKEIRNGQWYLAEPNIYKVRVNNKNVITRLGFPLQFDASLLRDKALTTLNPVEQQQVEFGFGLF